MTKKEEGELDRHENVFISILKSPYYLIRGFHSLFVREESEAGEEGHEPSKKLRGGVKVQATYHSSDIIKTLRGEYATFEKKWMTSESTIGIILGARGTGKTAFGVHFLENMHAKTKRTCYAMGFEQSEMPSWIHVISQVSDVTNDSVVLIDEGGILFSSRKSMTTPNKLLSDLILIARHKNLSILFISQNSANLDVNIIRQADFLIMKPSSLLQGDFERKKIKELYTEVRKDFTKLKEHKGLTYIYSDEFRGFINNPLPSFWSQRISKSFR